MNYENSQLVFFHLPSTWLEHSQETQTWTHTHTHPQQTNYIYYERLHLQDESRANAAVHGINIDCWFCKRQTQMETCARRNHRALLPSGDVEMMHLYYKITNTKCFLISTEKLSLQTDVPKRLRFAISKLSTLSEEALQRGRRHSCVFVFFTNV